MEVVMTKNERMLRIKYAKILSELTRAKLCPLLQEIALAIGDSEDSDERSRLEIRFKQVLNDIENAGARIDSLTSEKRMAKARLRLARIVK
jgi:hypothetical protein